MRESIEKYTYFKLKKQITMKYWMKFIKNDNEQDISLSDVSFLGRDLSIPELKERFNRDFIKNKTIKAIEIIFLGRGINTKLLAGFRNNKVVIVNTDTNEELNIKEFSLVLNDINSILHGKTTLLTQ